MAAVDREFLMRSGVLTINLAVPVLILGGCAGVGAAPRPAVQIQARPMQAGPMQAAAYDCRLAAQDVATPGPDVRLIMRPANQQGQLPLRVGQDGWQWLDIAPGSNGHVYANAIYAWRFNPTGGVLTDIRNIETYGCTGIAGAPAGALEQAR
jgi:hypothetical protein